MEMIEVPKQDIDEMKEEQKLGNVKEEGMPLLETLKPMSEENEIKVDIIESKEKSYNETSKSSSANLSVENNTNGQNETLLRKSIYLEIDEYDC